MLVKALGYDSLAKSVGENPFDDVTQNEGYITQAYDFGIITGKSGTVFDPSGSALREESAAMMMRLYERYTHKLDYVHGFYAISSWAQRDIAAQMDDISFGWSRLEYTPEAGVFLNMTGENGNDWKIPDGAEDAVAFFGEHNVGTNLAVMMNTSQTVTRTDGTQTDACRAVLLDENNRNQAAALLMQQARNYQGITIDFEGMKGQELKEGLNAFVKALKEKLGDKPLYVAVHPVLKNGGAYYDAYDYKTIGDYADKVILMAHDYAAASLDENLLGTDFNATPVTPFDEIYYALKAVTDPVTGVSDKDKIVLGVSLSSTAAWKVQDQKIIDPTPIHPAMDTIIKRLKQSSTIITYSQQYRNPYAYYQDDEGQDILLWYEDSRSIADKIQLARMFGVNGLSIWRIGAIGTDDTPGIYYDIWGAVQEER